MVPLQPGEQVVMIVRRHWFIFLTQLVVLAVIYILPFILYLFFIPFLTGESTLFPQGVERLPLPMLVFAGAIWTLIIWLRVATSWMDYFLDHWALTTQRVIDIEQKGFFSREVSSFRLDRIQDATTDIRGVIPTLLDFGDVHIQTAGAAEREFIIHGAPRPQEVKRRILAFHNKAIEERGMSPGGGL